MARLRDKLQLLAEEGVDRVLCLAFNQRLRSLSAAEFVDRILVDGLGVQHLEVGDDFHFGCDRVGDFDFLQHAGVNQGFTVEAAQTVELDGLRVSSTQVRNALAAADFDLAERLLGRPFRIAGRVLHGQKLARQLGTPTANDATQAPSCTVDRGLPGQRRHRRPIVAGSRQYRRQAHGCR